MSKYRSSPELVRFEGALPEQHDPDTEPDWETREYIEIKPSDRQLNAATVARQFQRLYTLKDQEGLLDRFFGDPPTIEFLLRATGGEDTRLAYLIGAEGIDLRDLERTLRAIFPDAYALERTTITPERLLTVDDDHAATPDVVDDVEATLAEDEQPEPYVAATELHGDAERRRDWMTRLTTLEDAAQDDQIPLTTVVEAMARADAPVVYQVLLRPRGDWSSEVSDRKIDLENGWDTRWQRFMDAIFGDFLPDSDDDGEGELSQATQRRIDAMEAKDSKRSFDLNVRAAALSYTSQAAAEGAVESVGTALTGCEGRDYQLRPATYVDGRETTGSPLATTAHDILRDIRARSFQAEHRGFRSVWPGRSEVNPEIVADPEEAPLFTLIDGSGVTTEGKRSLETVPEEREPVARPPPSQLARYRTEGFTIGHPATQDATTDDTPIAIAPDLQQLHLALFGKTGSGKSTLASTAILDNHAVTDGPDIVVEPKGGDMIANLLQAHFARHGTLENVYYFDCSEVLPALSFFDIRDDLDAGIDRVTAVEDTVDHYIELLKGVMGEDRFEQAVRSPDIIRYLLKALFDPVHGDDAFTHHDLQQAATRLHETKDPPAVSDDTLADLLGGVAANSDRSFDELMQGVANRIEKIPVDGRLDTLFNHTHDEDGPQFNFDDVLDEDALVIFDTGGLRSEAQRALTLVLLSELWAALRRRYDRGTDGPLVNLYLEEAAEVATSGIVDDLLARSREFGLSLTLAMQFPEQLKASDEATYREVLNNVSTVVAGNVSTADALAERFATAERDPSDVADRLRALERGQWFVDPAAPYGRPEPQPFVVESAPLPPGHPEGAVPLRGNRKQAFEDARERAIARTRREHGLSLAGDTTATVDDQTRDDTSDATTGDDLPTNLRSALPLTTRMPGQVRYDPETDVVVCEHCDTRYAPTAEKLRQALACCASRDTVDREAIPICKLPLTLSRGEIVASDYTHRQLAFLQAVYTAHQRNFDSDLEYDLLRDSMLRLREYVGIDDDAVDELIDDGLLVKDCNRPHLLYTVTPAGRDEIAVAHREGIAHGDGEGDLSESTLHVLMVAVGERYLAQEFVDDPDSPATETVTYHGVDDGRLDAAALDADGEVVATLEAERSNHDTLRAVPDDYDKMAAHEPTAAVWITENRSAAHEVLRALRAPADGLPRVEKEYSEGMRPDRFAIDQPGCTDILTVKTVMNDVL